MTLFGANDNAFFSVTTAGVRTNILKESAGDLRAIACEDTSNDFYAYNEWSMFTVDESNGDRTGIDTGTGACYGLDFD